MPRKILILFAHPRFEKSLNNSLLVDYIPPSGSITFHDLYQRYPDFNIDADYEKQLLTDHDVVIWQHPLYWYSAPPLLKQWIDIVLEFGWAYGPGGTKLAGKTVFNVITAGGQRTAYSKDGYNRFTINELLTPFEQTAALCKMIWLPPFAMHGTHRINREERLKTALHYKKLLEAIITDGIIAEEVKQHTYLNDWIEGHLNNQQL